MSVDMESKFSYNAHEEEYFLNLDALDNAGCSSSVGDTLAS